MKGMKKVILGMAVGMSMVFLCLVPSVYASVEKPKPLIQIAILLDTSNSMDGLINQAKSQLWKIVNEFATAKKNGQSPKLQVALYEYGNNSIPAGEGYVRMVLPLTTDLDKVSEELFALTTDGGSEYCGTVIKDAAGELGWSNFNSNYKAVFIAGNEPFTQGKIDYRKSCKSAITKGIIVNTIYCGPYETGIQTQWKDGADLADGKYMNIDQNRKAVHIDAPQDKKIAQLGTKLNQTYVPYGAKGMESKKRQEEQEKNALSVSPGSFLQRQAAKASSHYRNTSWDLVDAVKEGNIETSQLKDEELPEEMKKMDKKEKKEYVAAKTKEREEIKKEINKLNEARKKYVAEEMKKLSKPGEDTLDAVMIKTIQEQVSKKHFTFK